MIGMYPKWKTARGHVGSLEYIGADSGKASEGEKD
jgi:hypothetical protein